MTDTRTLVLVGILIAGVVLLLRFEFNGLRNNEPVCPVVHVSAHCTFDQPLRQEAEVFRKDDRGQCESYPAIATKQLARCLSEHEIPAVRVLKWACANEPLLMPELGIPQACNIGNPFVSSVAYNYILTTKVLVTNTFHVEYDGYRSGSKHPSLADPTCQAITMIGERRLNHMWWLLEDVIKQKVPGDFIETGVWHGGASLFAAAIFHAYGQTHRKVWLADSFKGIPMVDTSRFPVDKEHKGSHLRDTLIANNITTVRDHFRKLNLLQDNIEWLEGYFEHTLPPARARFTSFSVLRLDGDLYQSTWEALTNLYPYLNVGGYVIIDDYADWKGCREAVTDFRKKHNIKSPIMPVYHAPEDVVYGAWFQKTEPLA